MSMAILMMSSTVDKQSLCIHKLTHSVMSVSVQY